jgi:hypothetical protein
VNATQFLDLIQKADHLDKADLLQLKKVQDNFPYFQIPYVLTARYDYLKSKKKGKALGQAAITSPDRIWLKKLIEKPAPEESHHKAEQAPLPTEEITQPTKNSPKIAKDTESELPTVTPAESELSIVEAGKPKPRKRPAPKDDLIETIKRKEKKTIVDSKKKEQIDLIKAFSKKDIKLATIKEIEANQNTENLAESSTKLHDNLLSESFAKILANQGKKAMAKEIYEKLTLKFPEKRAYFADLIEKLKE